MPTESHMKRRISRQLCWTMTSSSLSVTRLSSHALIGGGSGRPSQLAWMCRAAASPKTKHSSSELDARRFAPRSEEHTSELQSLMPISYAVFCLNNKHKSHHHPN